jgi:hypothetical protein
MAVLVMMAGRSLLMTLKRVEGARRQQSMLEVSVSKNSTNKQVQGCRLSLCSLFPCSDAAPGASSSNDLLEQGRRAWLIANQRRQTEDVGRWQNMTSHKSDSRFRM